VQLACVLHTLQPEPSQRDSVKGHVMFMRPWAGGAQPAGDAPASQAPAPSQQGGAPRQPPAEGPRLPARTAEAAAHQLGHPEDGRSTQPPWRIAGSPAGFRATWQPARGDLRAAHAERLSKSSGGHAACLQDCLIDVHMRNMTQAFKHRHVCTKRATCMDVDCVKSTARRTNQRLRDNFQRWLRKNIVCHKEFAKCENITRKLLLVSPLIGSLKEVLRHTYGTVFGWDRGRQWSSLLTRETNQTNKQPTCY